MKFIPVAEMMLTQPILFKVWASGDQGIRIIKCCRHYILNAYLFFWLIDSQQIETN